MLHIYHVFLQNMQDSIEKVGTYEASDPICERVVFWARLRVYPED